MTVTFEKGRCSCLQHLKTYRQPTEEDVPLKGWLEEQGHSPAILETSAAGHEFQRTSPQIFVDNNPSPFLPARM